MMGSAFLSPDSYEKMWTPVAKRGSPPLYEDHGLGWILGHFEGVKTVSHGGGALVGRIFSSCCRRKSPPPLSCAMRSPSARSRTIRAVIHAMLDHEPQAGTVSWMVPINQALQAGGIQAAYARYEELKGRQTQEYFFQEDELVTLMYQLRSVKKIELAIDVLGLNLSAFPEHMDSYIYLAQLYLQQGGKMQAEKPS